jgi:hypothetical protein
MALWSSLAAFTVKCSDVGVFQLLGINGVGYSLVIKILQYIANQWRWDTVSDKTLVPLSMCNN